MNSSVHSTQSIRRVAWLRIALVGIAALFGLALFWFKEKASSVEITNAGPGFQVLSVRITSGTNAAIYFPSRWQYAQMQTEAWLHEMIPAFKAHYGYAFKLQDWHAANFTCWIEFKSTGDPGRAQNSAKASVEYAGLRSDWVRLPDDHNVVHNVVTHRGILYWPIQANTLRGCRLRIVTDLGDSTVQFR